MNVPVPFPLLKNVLTVLGGKVSMSLYEILRLEGDGNYTRFVLTDGTHVITSKSLKYYEEGLTKAGFVRIGKSYIVNRGHIKKIKKNELMLTDGKCIEVARRRRKEISNTLKSDSV